MQYRLTIKVDAASEAEVKQLGALLQKVINSTDVKDVTLLLDKVVKNPALVKTAIRFA